MSTSSEHEGLRWATGTRIAYHSGIVALLADLGLALAPQHGIGPEANLRWSATGIALAACAGETAFIFRRWLDRVRQR